MDIQVRNIPVSAALCQHCGRPIVAPDQPVSTSLGWYHAECARSPHKQVATLTKCGECAFWIKRGPTMETVEIGVRPVRGACHRHPPAVDMDRPVTKADDCCGDGVARPQTGPSEEEKTDV